MKKVKLSDVFNLLDFDTEFKDLSLFFTSSNLYAKSVFY